MVRSKTRVRMSKEERRSQILNSAMRVFVEKGYNGTTTIDIAREASISEVTLFRYFSSKKELFMAGIEPILVTSLENSLIAAKDLKVMEKLKYILKDRIKYISQHHKVIKLILMESQVNQEMADLNYIENTSCLLKESIKEAGIQFKEEDMGIRLLTGSILSFLYLPELEEENIDSYVERFVDMISSEIIL